MHNLTSSRYIAPALRRPVPGVLGQRRSVVMSGSRLDLVHDGKQWCIVRVSDPRRR